MHIIFVFYYYYYLPRSRNEGAALQLSGGWPTLEFLRGCTYAAPTRLLFVFKFILVRCFFFIFFYGYFYYIIYYRSPVHELETCSLEVRRRMLLCSKPFSKAVAASRSDVNERGEKDIAGAFAVSKGDAEPRNLESGTQSGSRRVYLSIILIYETRNRHKIIKRHDTVD